MHEYMVWSAGHCNSVAAMMHLDSTCFVDKVYLYVPFCTFTAHDLGDGQLSRVLS